MKRTFRAKKGGPQAVDIEVGARVRQERKAQGISQERIAEALGITFQQQQKSERGANRISASRLKAIADFLGKPVGFFFGDGNPAPVTADPVIADCIGLMRGLDHEGRQIVRNTAKLLSVRADAGGRRVAA